MQCSLLKESRYECKVIYIWPQVKIHTWIGYQGLKKKSGKEHALVTCAPCLELVSTVELQSTLSVSRQPWGRAAELQTWQQRSTWGRWILGLSHKLCPTCCQHLKTERSLVRDTQAHLLQLATKNILTGSQRGRFVLRVIKVLLHAGN